MRPIDVVHFCRDQELFPNREGALSIQCKNYQADAENPYWEYLFQN